MHFGAQSRGLRAPCERFAPWVTPGPRITRFRLAADLGRMGLDTHRVSNKVSKITSRPLVPLDRAFPAHALGIDTTGTKHPLGLWEGATENATVCQGLLTNLASRGLRTDRSLLVIVDGAKALETAVTQTFGRAAVVQRCQVHKGRNILEHLPEAQRPWVKAILTRAYTNATVKTAKRLLQDLARRLDTDHPSAAASVREGLDETLTVLGLGLSERLQRSLATTNAIESLLSRTRHVKRNVKRWRGGTMVLRWVAAGVLEAAKGFRRVKGCQDMPALVAALRARDARLGLGESSAMVA